MIPQHKVTQEEHLTWYVVNHYVHLMTKAEWLANRAFLIKLKIEHGYSPESFTDLETHDPEVLVLMRDGPQLFWDRVRDRILRDRPEQVILTCCPKCGGLARTPRARQCPWCYHSWH